MICPKCNNQKTNVIDTVHTPMNETYRYRKCPNCYNMFYTIESEVEINSRFRVNWSNYHRKHNKTAKTQ